MNYPKMVDNLFQFMYDKHTAKQFTFLFVTNHRCTCDCIKEGGSELKLKKIFGKAIAILTVAAMAFSFSASAVGIKWTDAPSVKLGQWVAGPKYSLTGSQHTAEGKNTYTYFQNYKSLSTTFGDRSRGLEIYLMEDDFWNANDQVKLYYGEFSGRTLSKITLTKTLFEGALDNPNDPTCELYIELKVYKGSNPDDPMDKYTGSLFQYTYGIN